MESAYSFEGGADLRGGPSNFERGIHHLRCSNGGGGGGGGPLHVGRG